MTRKPEDDNEKYEAMFCGFQVGAVLGMIVGSVITWWTPI